jgi:ribosomal protein S21
LGKKKKANNYQLSAKEVGGDQEKLIRKFCKKIKKLGILDEVRDRQYYVKPSVKRRLKKLNKKRMSKKQNQRQEAT